MVDLGRHTVNNNEFARTTSKIICEPYYTPSFLYMGHPDNNNSGAKRMQRSDCSTSQQSKAT